MKCYNILVENTLKAIENPLESENSIRKYIDDVILFQNLLDNDDDHHHLSCGVGTAIYKCLIINKNFDHLHLRFLLTYVFCKSGIRFSFRYYLNPPFHLWDSIKGATDWASITKTVENDIELQLKKGYIFFKHFSFLPELGRDPTFLICIHYLISYFQEVEVNEFFLPRWWNMANIFNEKD